jgi:hypothetical protein
MTPGVARAVGFLVTMVGVGIRLDSSWTTVGTLVLGAGCVVGGWGLLTGAFVREEVER